MKTQVNEHDVFVQLVIAMEQGNIKHLRKMDKLIRKTLNANITSKKSCNGLLVLNEEDASLFCKMGLSVR